MSVTEVLGTQSICLSGGAKGADQQWGMTAGKAGHMVVHWSFKGHKTHVPSSEVVELSPEQLEEANPHCKRASVGIKRWFPPKNEFVGNLLRRNWYQVENAESVYAVANLTDEGVSGGTAWAVQMFIDRHDGAACPVYLFDQISEQWFTWTATGWNAITEVPPPTGVWAGIGSRDLTNKGKEAIRALMGWNPQGL